jgi:hypothetical protein
LGKTTDVVSRLLSRPRNWELGTFSDLLFAISGAVPRFDADYPLVAPKDRPSVEEVSVPQDAA